MAPGSRANLALGFLDHPRFWASRDVVLTDRPRPNTPTGGFMTFQLFDNNLSQGRLRAALAYLEDPLMFPGLRAASYYTISSLGLAVPDVAFHEAVALDLGDTLPADHIGSTLIWFYAGAYAADRGHWEDHAAALARLRTRADQLLAEGDSGGSRFAKGASMALSGRELWRRGDLPRALPLLVDGQRETTWGGGGASAHREALNGTIRWWLGELVLQMGRPRDAAVYFESFWNDPLAAERLGPIYERIGDPEKAREAYSLIASAWRNADPELQARARAAYASVQRLTRLTKE
jgi:tetratricopeptide (TPR) repeat protein